MFISEEGADFLIAVQGSWRKAYQRISDRLTYSKRLPFQARLS
jgi:hypothetical protein